MEPDESAAAGATADVMVNATTRLNIVAAFRICFCMIRFLLVSHLSEVGLR
jgi:hypothetical protein